LEPLNPIQGKGSTSEHDRQTFSAVHKNATGLGTLLRSDCTTVSLGLCALSMALCIWYRYCMHTGFRELPKVVYWDQQRIRPSRKKLGLTEFRDGWAEKSLGSLTVPSSIPRASDAARRSITADAMDQTSSSTMPRLDRDVYLTP
jgi:hypothetical protein